MVAQVNPVDVLDELPKLDFVLAHAGGAFPGAVGRMDHGAAVRKKAKMPRLPSTYIRRFYSDQKAERTDAGR